MVGELSRYRNNNDNNNNNNNNNNNDKLLKVDQGIRLGLQLMRSQNRNCLLCVFIISFGFFLFFQKTGQPRGGGRGGGSSKI